MFDFFLSVFPFDLGTVALQPGGVYDAEGDLIWSSIRQQLERVIDGKSKYLGKDVFHVDNGWKDVSEKSYQTWSESETLGKDLEAILGLIQEASIIVELGPGTFTKTRILLDALNQEGRNILYVAVDISKSSLQEHIPALDQWYGNIVCVGFWGTFDQALNRLKPSSAARICTCSFGSSLSNGPREDNILNLQRWASVSVVLMIGQDATLDNDQVDAPYHTEAFNQFMRNGLQKADDIVGRKVFASDSWTHSCTIRDSPTRHTFVMTAAKDVCGSVKEGTRFKMFTSFKYSERDIGSMVTSAGCTMKETFAASGAGSRIYIIQPSKHKVFVPRSS